MYLAPSTLNKPARSRYLLVTSTEIATYSINCISYEDPKELCRHSHLIRYRDREAPRLLGILSRCKPGDGQRVSRRLGVSSIECPCRLTPAIMDVLRNEKPVYFTFYDYRPMRLFGAIGTAREPVGEAEIK